MALDQIYTRIANPQGPCCWLWADLSLRTEEERQNLLSDDVVVMTSVHLESAVVGPQVNRCGNSAYTTLIHHLSSLCATYREFKICVFLPISEEERELLNEAVVYIAHEFNRGGTRVACYAALKLRGASDDRLPSFELIFVLDL